MPDSPESSRIGRRRMTGRTKKTPSGVVAVVDQNMSGDLLHQLAPATDSPVSECASSRFARKDWKDGKDGKDGADWGWKKGSDSYASGGTGAKGFWGEASQHVFKLHQRCAIFFTSSSPE